MGKALIIAEKPSVASDISKALGKFQKHDDYFENDDYVISSAVGHLLTIAVPEQFEVKRGKWTFAHLPVIPPHFDLLPIEKNEARLKVLVKLIKRKDVTTLVNACDAGREGELIFRYIVQYAKAKQPIQRLWLQSMTPAAIRDGFAHLRTDGEMIPLADAATCRSESDWLDGYRPAMHVLVASTQEPVDARVARVGLLGVGGLLPDARIVAYRRLSHRVAGPVGSRRAVTDANGEDQAGWDSGAARLLSAAASGSALRRSLDAAAYATGGGVPSALASSAGSHSQAAQAWRNADRANSSATACGLGAARTSSQSRMYSPSAASHRAAAGESVALANPSGAGWA